MSTDDPPQGSAAQIEDKSESSDNGGRKEVQPRLADGLLDLSQVEAKGETKDLLSVVKPLLDDAQSNARHIVAALVGRAVKTSKSSDEPYRKLLDIFTEDFLNVLGSSDWPAAELLLRALVDRPRSHQNQRGAIHHYLGSLA